MGKSDKYDTFLTHDWSFDGSGRNNHARVSKVNEKLKQRGIVTWFDEERMEGNAVEQMCTGIDEADSRGA
eukprot:SAG31_NODE_24791_length_474_cov_0.725333_1_plen_69_part_01